jgi:carbon storage regulator
MLVLSRKPQQSICIGDDICITILRIDRGRVKVGIEAPANVQVDRGEIRKTATPAARA